MYNEELFTSLFDILTKTEIGVICIKFDFSVRTELNSWPVNKDALKNIFTQIQNKLENLETQNILSNEMVFLFIFHS